MSIINSNSSSVPKSLNPNNKLVKNINSNIKQLTPEEYKFFFKRYVRNKSCKKIKTDSETDSTFDELPENNNELNSIYLSNLNNLNKFLQKKNNLRGITLRGNRFLENISINKFNEFFREYGKNIEKKLKKHILKFFYPNNNKPKLMGQKMNLTPIPVKRNIFLKNEKEKKDYKNAERAAVILRRLEYTHGLGDKRDKREKILFYLMKGAALIIEDWWINILNNKQHNGYNTFLNKLNDIEKESGNNIDDNKNNNHLGQNKFVFKQNQKKKLNNDKNLEIKINKKMYKINNNNNDKGKVNKNKKNKIEIVEINLDVEQNKENEDNKPFNSTNKNHNQAEIRYSAPIYSNINLNRNYSTKNNIGDKNKENNINKNNKMKKAMSAQNIFQNNDNYELKIDKYKNKERKLKPNPMKLIVTKSVTTENKNKNLNRDKEDKIINKHFNPNLKKPINNDHNASLSNRFNSLKLNHNNEISKIPSTKNFKASSYKKESTGNNKNDIILNEIQAKKLFNKGNDISKAPNRIEKIKSKNSKVKSQPKIKLKQENENNNKNRNKKGIKRKEKFSKDKDKNKYELVMENNINLLIVNDEYDINEKRNNNLKHNLNMSNDNIINNDNNKNNKDLNKLNKDVKNIKENNDENNDADLKNNKPISVVSIIGYKLKDDFNYRSSFNSFNDINSKKINNSNNNEVINNKENNKINEIENENNTSKEKDEINNNNINQSKKDLNDLSENNSNNLINEESPKNKNECNNENKDMNNRKASSNINQKNEEIRDNNESNNILIHINESSKENNEENNITNSKKGIIVPELNIVNNKINNNIHNNDNEGNSNCQEIEEGSFKFNKNSFFFNNSNNVIMVNIDNNTDYDETEIKKINLKKNYYTKYTTNIIKININNTDYNIINKKLEDKIICLTDRNELNSNQNRKSKASENINNLNEEAKSQRQEKDLHKIKYTIIQNNNNKSNNKPFNALEKTSFDGSVDEIISNQLMKIHNNNNETNKQRIDKAYNKFQLRKSQNLKNNIYNNFEKIENDSNYNNEKDSKMVKSKSSGKFMIKNDIYLNKE